MYRAPGQGVRFYDLASGAIKYSNWIAGVPVKVKGLEAEISAQLARNWTLGGNISYSIAKISNGFIPCDGTVAPTASNVVNGCTVSQRAGTMAPLSANLQSEYSKSVGSVDAYVRGLINFTGASQGDPQYAGDNVKAYALANLYLGVRDPKGAWDISAYVKNLTNLKIATFRDSALYSVAYVVNGGSPTGGVGGTLTSNYRGVSITAPREFGINLRYAFGSR